MRVTKVVRVGADEWRVSLVDEHLPGYHQEETIGLVSRGRDGALYAHSASWPNGALLFSDTGLKFDSLYDAATALADAAVR